MEEIGVFPDDIQVGDVLHVREDLNLGLLGVVRPMLRLAGRDVVVSYVSDNRSHIHVEGSGWNWYDNCFDWGPQESGVAQMDIEDLFS